MLQKRRELKAAGVDMKLTGVKKRKYIDFAREVRLPLPSTRREMCARSHEALPLYLAPLPRQVPFQKAVPAGFYDVGEENSASRAAANRIDPKVRPI